MPAGNRRHHSASTRVALPARQRCRNLLNTAACAVIATNDLPVRQALFRGLAIAVMTPAGHRTRRIGQGDQVAPRIVFISSGGAIRTGLFN
jgi:hypothetical protein